MLNKLLKYDLKYMIKNMGIFYVLAIIFAILTRIFFALDQTTIIEIIGQISVGCLFSILVSILINTMMRSWVRFRDFLYKDESYLTHTLPVSKNSIYQSKFIQTLIFTFVSFIVIVIGLFIAYYTKDRWFLLKDTINGISKGLNVNTTVFIICVILILFLEIFNAIQSGYIGIILGHRKNNNKVPFSFVYGFIFYILSQAFVVFLLFIAGLFNKEILDLFTTNVVISNSNIKFIVLFAIISYSLIIFIMNLLSVKFLKNGVNIE